MIVSIANQKGGAGKTAISLILAAGLTSAGYKVLTVDLDGQCTFTNNTGVKFVKTIADLLRSDATFHDVAIKNEDFGYIIPGSRVMYTSQTVFKNMDSLKQVLEPLQKYFHYIILDTPPAWGKAMVSALYASDYALIPAVPDRNSADGISEILQTIDNVKEKNKKLKALGVVVNMYEKRSNLHKQYKDVIRECCEDTRMFFFTPIRKSIVVPESFSMEQSLFKYAPKHKVLDDCMDFINEFLAHTKDGER